MLRSARRHPPLLTFSGTPNPTALCVLMHGLGDTAHGWADAAESLARRRSLSHVKFVLPTATEQPVSINGGASCTSWYDIRGLPSRQDEACEGIEESAAYVRSIVASEALPSSRVVLSGFSQGGALTLFTGLSHPARLAGLACLSGYLPKPRSLAPTAHVRALPVLLAHGTADSVVPFAQARGALQELRRLGAENVELLAYEGMGHTACDEEIEAFAAFLERTLPVVEPGARADRGG